MRPLCSICQELFIEIDILVSTKCGHIFHNHCLHQWLEGSKSCPHCRNKTQAKDIVRLYVDTATTGNTQQDPTSLIQKVDSLALQVSLKDQENASLREQTSKLEKQTETLRKEYKKVEAKLKDKEMGLAAYKAQIDMFKCQVIEYQQSKKEIQEMRNKLALLKGVEKIICEEDDEINSILAAHSFSDLPEVRQLATYCAALKREMTAASEAKKKLRDELKTSRQKISSLQQQLDLMKLQVNDWKCKEDGWNADLKRLEEQNSSLLLKVAKLQAALTSPSGDPRSSALNRFIHESPAPLDGGTPAISSGFVSMPGILPETPKPKMLKLQSRMPLSDCDANSDSDSTKHSSQSNHSAEEIMDLDVEPVILKRFTASRLNPNPSYQPSPDVNYDGFGGRGKADIFPKPRLGQAFKLRRTGKSSNSSSSIPKKITYKIAGKNVQSTTLDKFF